MSARRARGTMLALAAALMVAAPLAVAGADERDGRGGRGPEPRGQQSRQEQSRQEQHRQEQYRQQQARQNDWDRRHWRDARRGPGYHGRPDIYYSAPPVVHLPPRYYQPAPPGLSLNFGFPLYY